MIKLNINLNDTDYIAETSLLIALVNGNER